MSAAQRVRVAVVGAGAFAQSHLAAYAHIDRAEVAWVCDPDLEAARRTAERWGVRSVAADLEDVLADDGVDLVDLVTPVALHAPQATSALTAGRSVLCEKPMALDLAEAEAVAAVAASARGELHVKFHQRFDPVHERVRDLLRDGTGAVVAHFTLLGDHLAALRSRTHWRGDPRFTGGGSLFESGSHLLDLAHFWFGPATRVTATVHQLVADNPAKGEDTATVVVEFDGGVVLTLVGFWAAPAWDWRKDVFTADQVQLTVETGRDNVLRRRARDGASEVVAVQEGWFDRSVEASIRHVVECCAGDATPLVTVED